MDFSIKIYIKFDVDHNLLMSVTISPIIHKQKP